jgi:hypothetical protein
LALGSALSAEAGDISLRALTATIGKDRIDRAGDAVTIHDVIAVPALLAHSTNPDPESRNAFALLLCCTVDFIKPTDRYTGTLLPERP